MNTPPSTSNNPHSSRISTQYLIVFFTGIFFFIAGYFTTIHIYRIFETSAPDTGALLSESIPSIPITKPIPPPQPYTLLFLGDMMFDRGVATNIRKRGGESVFASGTREITDLYDLVIANLEGPITTYPSRTIDVTGKAIPGFSFTFPTSTARLLAESGIDIVSLANNHADNFGREGLIQTIQYLKDAEIDYFGNTTNSPFDIASSSHVYCPTRDSVTTDLAPDTNIPTCIAFIGYHQFTYKNESHILAEITRYETDPRIAFTIVFPHWGEEYQKRPNQNQISLAHKWVDTGADLIIGAHPHVVQSTEIYKGAYIYYSLGNYIFDQYFSYDTTHGIAVGITLSPDLRKVQSTEIIPIDITGTIVRKANDIDSQKILKDIEYIEHIEPIKPVGQINRTIESDRAN